MLDAKNRVIMVSGANRGIGLATAEHLIKKGYLVSLAARNPDEIPIQNGVLTPSVAFGNALLKRLEKNADLKFKIKFL